MVSVLEDDVSEAKSAQGMYCMVHSRGCPGDCRRSFRPGLGGLVDLRRVVLIVAVVALTHRGQLGLRGGLAESLLRFASRGFERFLCAGQLQQRG